MKKLYEFGREWKYKIKDFFARPTLKEYINGRYKSFLAFQEARKTKVPLGHWIALGIVIAGFIGITLYFYHTLKVAEYYKTHTLEVEPLYQPATEYIESMNKETIIVVYEAKEEPTPQPTDIIGLAYQKVVETWGSGEWQAFEILIYKESGWNPQAINRSSGACGLFQALPCSKMGGMEINNQINWGVNYIKNRYGTPKLALNWHYQHNWY